MRTLFQGARDWASESDHRTAGEGRSPDEDHPTLAAYRSLALRNRLWSPRRYASFCELLRELEEGGDDDVREEGAEGEGTEGEGGEVVTVEEGATSGVGAVVRFRPSAVRLATGGARGSQRRAFRTLCGWWMRAEAGAEVGELHVHLESVTSSEVARITSSSTASDVRLGIGIWSTLPVRIRLVRVHEPLSPPWAWSVGRLLLPQLLPRKVLAKTAFLQPDHPPPEKREVDG